MDELQGVACLVFYSLLSVSSGDETLYQMLDITSQTK